MYRQHLRLRFPGRMVALLYKLRVTATAVALECELRQESVVHVPARQKSRVSPCLLGESFGYHRVILYTALLTTTTSLLFIIKIKARSAMYRDQILTHG